MSVNPYHDWVLANRDHVRAVCRLPIAEQFEHESCCLTCKHGIKIARAVVAGSPSSDAVIAALGT